MRSRTRFGRQIGCPEVGNQMDENHQVKPATTHDIKTRLSNGQRDDGHEKPRNREVTLGQGRDEERRQVPEGPNHSEDES